MRYLLIPLFLVVSTTYAQDLPKSGSTMGIPMLTDTDMRARSAPGQGSMIFNTSERSFYWFDGNDWQPLLTADTEQGMPGVRWSQQRPGTTGGAKISNGTTGFWDLTGNSGTTFANFLGTTDKQDLRFKVENIHAGRIQAPPQLPLPDLFIPQFDHTSFGLGAGKLDAGNANSFFGSSAGTSLQDGTENTAIGFAALGAHNGGEGNTAIGSRSHATNAATGLCTSLGFMAGPTGALNNATAIGAQSSVTTNNSLVLGSINGVNGATSDVNVGIGTTAPARALHISRGASGGTSNPGALAVLEDNANSYLNLMTPDANESGVLFGTPTSNAEGGVIYNTGATPNGLAFRTNGNATRAVIDGNGLMGIGTTTPATKLDVNGGLSVRLTSTQTVPVGNNNVTVGDRSYMRFSSTGSSALILSNGLVTGQMLLIESGGGTITVADNAATSNCNLAANRSLGTNDVLTLIWNGLDWVEVSFTNN